MHCHGATLDLGDFRNDNDVHEAEEFLADTTLHIELHGSTLNADKTGKHYQVAFPSASPPVHTKAALKLSASCIYKDVTVPDIIARIKKGKCWICNEMSDRARVICPERDPGTAEKFGSSTTAQIYIACLYAWGGIPRRKINCMR